MFETVLVANRGEIARRIIRTAQRLGLQAVAVHSEADAELPFVREADEAVAIGPAHPAQSYRNAEAILLRRPRQTGAQAIHPGYGFLAENAGVRPAGRATPGWSGSVRRRRRSRRWATRSTPATWSRRPACPCRRGTTRAGRRRRGGRAGGRATSATR